MTAGRAGALVLVIDVRRRIERLLQAPRAIERRGAPQAIDVHHLARNIDLRLRGELLLDQFHRKDRRQILRRQRLMSARMQRRGERLRERWQHVHPDRGDLAVGKKEFGGFRHGRLIVIRVWGGRPTVVIAPAVFAAGRLTGESACPTLLRASGAGASACQPILHNSARRWESDERRKARNGAEDPRRPAPPLDLVTM